MGAITQTNIAVEQMIQLYGWDCRTGTWSGPTGLEPAGPASKRLLATLQATPVKSWFGPLRIASPGEPPAQFFVVLHDREDCAIAMVYCADSKTGPAEVLAVIPAGLRPRLRPEFAFEFLAFASFLGAIGESAAIVVHDRISEAIEEAPPGEALAFSLCTGTWPSDRDPALSRCVETLASTLLLWLSSVE